MKIAQLVRLAPALIQARTSVHLIGAPGVGKSSVVKQICDSVLDGVMAKAMLANYGPMDVPGYGIPAKDKKGRDIMTHTLPAWSIMQDKSVVWDHARGMVFLDELRQSELEVQKSAAPLVLDGEAGHHRLPQGWVVWMASNRASDRSGVSRALDHLINRTMEIHLENDEHALSEYLRAKGYPDWAVAYVLRRPERVFSDAPKDQGPWMTPRSYEMGLQFLLACSPDRGDTIPTDDPAIQEALGGHVGEASAADILTFVALRHELPEMADVLNSPTKAKVPSGYDAMMIVCEMLGNTIKVDNADAIIAYVRRMPDDIGVSFCKTAVRKLPALLRTKAFTKWTADNHGIVAAIASLPSNA